jgi:protease-4
MRRHCALLFAAMLVCGCLHPLRTESTVTATMTAPMKAEIKSVTSAPLPTGDDDPVTAMPLPGYGCGDGPCVGLIDVDGLLLNQKFVGPYAIGENPVAAFREKLDAAARAGVGALVLRINSPGGGVTATDVMWQELNNFRARTGKPVVACLMDVAAGGGYYLATAADVILAHPTTLTGGIGVIWNSYNLKDMMLQQNIFHQPIKAGANIDMGTVTTPLPAEAKRLLQAMADEFHDRFKRVVLKARPAVDPNNTTTFDGRIFTATQAQQLGLVDRLGYLDDAIAAARAAAGSSAGSVVVFHRPSDPAFTPYASTPNVPVQGSGIVPVNIPGLERSRLPTFLYLWQPDPTLEKLGGR